MLAQKSFTSARPVRQARSRCTVRTHAYKLPKWEIVYDYLVREKALQTISPEEAKELADSGKWVLVDVRPMEAYKQSHPAGAINVPMYQGLDWSKPDFGKVLKFIAYSSNGVTPVEPNPQFAQQMREVTDNGAKGVITICEAGGTLKPSTNFPAGKPSRSLQAAYRVMAEGVTEQVAHMDRGAFGWYQADFDFEGEGEYKPDLGRTPQAAAEPTLRNIAQSTGYAMREGDKKTF